MHLFRNMIQDGVGLIMGDPNSFYEVPLDAVYLMVRVAGRTSEARYLIELLDAEGKLAYLHTTFGFMELACPITNHSH
jgi:hypothetical protein